MFTNHVHTYFITSKTLQGAFIHLYSKRSFQKLKSHYRTLSKKFQELFPLFSTSDEIYKDSNTIST